MTGFCQLTDDITVKWRGGINVISIDLGVIHGKAIVVFSCYHQILHAALLSECDDFFGIEVQRIEGGCQVAILSIRNLKF